MGRKGKLAAQREAAAAEAAEELRSRSKRERAADIERGPPPEPTRSFRLPQQLLPDLLTIWELLQTLAPVLQVRQCAHHSTDQALRMCGCIGWFPFP